MKAQVGDYIVVGIKGEIYPCKPDIFEATYEENKESKPMSETKTIEERVRGIRVLLGVIKRECKGDFSVPLHQANKTLDDLMAERGKMKEALEIYKEAVRIDWPRDLTLEEQILINEFTGD